MMSKRSRILNLGGLFFFLLLNFAATVVKAFQQPHHHQKKKRFSSSSSSSRSSSSPLHAAPRRLDENVDGPLYINEKCINCSACAMFAPEIFERNLPQDNYHIVHSQPTLLSAAATTTTDDDNNSNDDEILKKTREAIIACPVAAIRVETDAYRNHNKLPLLSKEEKQIAQKLAINPKFNGLEVPFPKPMMIDTNNEMTKKEDQVYYTGYHNEKSFGAVPYLVYSKTHEGWIMVDTPKYTKAAIDSVASVTGPDGPKYMFLTHVDDTAGHGQWKEHFPSTKRIFHSGDLGRYNWIGDKTLDDVEILLHDKSNENQLQYFTLDGNPVDYNDNTDDDDDKDDVYIVHTPGHSPGSITLWKRPTTTTNTPGIIFTGDTYGYTTRYGGQMTGFARYGNNRKLQSKIIQQLLELDWQYVAPGHGQPRDYYSSSKNNNHNNNKSNNKNTGAAAAKYNNDDPRAIEMEDAIKELSRW